MSTIQSELSPATAEKLENLITPSTTEREEREKAWTEFYKLRRKMYWKSKKGLEEVRIKIKDMSDLHIKRVIRLINEKSKSEDTVWYSYKKNQWLDVFKRELRYRNEMVREFLGLYLLNKDENGEIRIIEGNSQKSLTVTVKNMIKAIDESEKEDVDENGVTELTEVKEKDTVNVTEPIES